jgi:acyl CoA:acetate/3-ketoacid CoA transferase beta subunit
MIDCVGEEDADLVHAGAQPITALNAASIVGSDASFAMIDDAMP